MDFRKIIPVVIAEFKKENIRYALIGGFAMGAVGVMRSTMDIDFLVDKNDLDKVKKVMGKYNYHCVYSNENVSQYVSDLKIFGEIDFLHAFREISLDMINMAKEIEIFEGKQRIRVSVPEDIIGLKLQAAVNNPQRNTREFADIEMIMDTLRNKLDWQRIEGYFSLFKLAKKFGQLKKAYDKK
jgi:hypothetical protein